MFGMSQKLILVGGMPGSGKTYIGIELARRLGVFIDKDTISRFFTEKILTLLGSDANDRESNIYLSNVRDLEYQTMIKHALENLKVGKNVICSAPFISEFNDQDWLDDINLEAELIDSEVVKIWIHVDLPTARERIIARGATRDNWKLANWEDYIKQLPKNMPDRDQESSDIIVIDNSQTPNTPLFKRIDAVVSIINGGTL